MHPDAKRLNDLSERIIGAAIDVHRALGPGLLESPYEECLCHELAKRALTFERQKPLPLVYGDVRLPCAFRLDLVVERSIVVEIKSVLVLNFNVKNLSREGVMRKVNNFPE